MSEFGHGAAPPPATGLGLFQKLGCLFRAYAIPHDSLVVPGPFARDDRNCFTFGVPVPWESDDGGRSPVVLLEDGEPLGPARCGHDDIRTLGRGRYSHWGPKIYFSSSDNSDPNTNGRVYSVMPPEGWRRGWHGVLPQTGTPPSGPDGWAERERPREPEPGERVSVEWSLTDLAPDTIDQLADGSYSVAVPGEWPSDLDDTSTLMLLEDGKPLPLAHATHAEIATLGGGRYSHWGSEVRFSTSDGGDPRANGKTYSIARAEAFLFRFAPSQPIAEQGRCWILDSLPRTWTSDQDGRSRLVLLEDGLALGPAHSSHDDIRALGAGRYCHWGRQLWFSTGDGSSPLENGRTYTVVRLDGEA
ncbi:MAG: hypothetical protein H6825_00710 [Planctomycetes bacterium]|nr:hypothetical protein [Planctomycetota bacterium]